MKSGRPEPLSPPALAHLEFRGVSVSYNGHPALRDISFQLPQGGRVALVGPNGAGKSTLFKALVGLLPLAGGQILIHGLPLSDQRTCVAYIPQRGQVDWRFPVTVWDVVMMGRFTHTGWLRKPTRRDHQVVAAALEQVGITRLARQSIGRLSGGEQQRTFLARAVAQEPHILLMDEPFTGVDAPTQEAVLELLDRLHNQRVTVLVSTHDLDLAARRFENVLLLNRQLIAYGPADQVFQPEILRKAFSGHGLFMDGLMLVDECCHDEENPEQSY